MTMETVDQQPLEAARHNKDSAAESSHSIVSSDASELRQRYIQDGFFIVRGLFTQAEVQAFRAECASRDAAMSYVGLADFSGLVMDPRILAAMRAALGENLVYFGDSTCRDKDIVGGLYSKWYARHFHADARVEDYDFSKPYELARCGLYLQNTSDYSGGLKVRPGSHRMACREQLGIKGTLKVAMQTKSVRFIFAPGSSYNVPVQPGDLVVWNLRLHHAGYAVRIKGMPKVSFPPIVENLIPEFLHVPAAESRSVIFMTYGAEGAHTDRMAKNRWRNKDLKSFWLDQCSQAELVDAAASKGLRVKRPD